MSAVDEKRYEEMIEIPYGTGQVQVQLGVEIEGAELELLEWSSTERIHTGAETDADMDIIQRAVRNPIGTKPLGEILALASRSRNSKSKSKRIVIVVDDHTRNAPTERMLDALYEEIERQEQEWEIILLVACGTHPAPSTGDLRRILGKYYDHRGFRVVIHDCDAPEPDLVYVGTTTRGTPVRLNRIYKEADVRILTGDITLHYYAGFGGGRKSILPGISARETIMKNHALLVDERARTANIEDNPVHLDMSEAASFAPPDFVLNTVADAAGNIVAAYAGELNAVFSKGAGIAKGLFWHETGLYDVIVVSAGGFPNDRNLYQATKAIQNCYQAVLPGGSLILVAECREGVGDIYFEEWMNEYKSYEAAEEAVRTKFLLGGHKAFYMRKLMRRVRLSIVSELDPDMLTGWGIKAYRSLRAALDGEIGARGGGRGNKLKIGIVRNGLDTLLVPVPELS